MRKITLCLGFNKNVDEAVNTYVTLFNRVFGNSEIVHVTRFGEKEIEELKNVPAMSQDIMPGKAGDVKTIHFTLNGEEIVAFTGGAYFGKFNESMSLYVTCETQEQIDELWDTLSDEGEEQPCGWVKDKFGVSWQIAPSLVWDIDESSDRETAERMNTALFKMKKINIERLMRACGE